MCQTYHQIHFSTVGSYLLCSLSCTLLEGFTQASKLRTTSCPGEVFTALLQFKSLTGKLEMLLLK